MNASQNRMKYFWLSFTPLLTLLVIQSACSFFVMELELVHYFRTNTATIFSAFLTGALKALSGPASMSLILFCYGVCALLTTALWYRAFRRKRPADAGSRQGPFAAGTQGGSPSAYTLESKRDVKGAFTDARDSLRTYKKGRLIAGIILCGVTFQVVMNYFTTVLAMIRPDWLKTYEDAMKASGIGADSVSVFIILYMFIGPLSEELCFRGLTYGYARRAMGFWGANAVQAILFGIFHLNPLQGIMAAVVGFLFGYIYGKTENIFITMGVHLIFNATSFVMGGLDFTSLPPFVFFLVILGCLIATYAAVRLILSAQPVAVPKEKAYGQG